MSPYISKENMQNYAIALQLSKWLNDTQKECKSKKSYIFYLSYLLLAHSLLFCSFFCFLAADPSAIFSRSIAAAVQFNTFKCY